MKKRLIKKAYKRAMSGINTRIRPKGHHGKAIAIFNECKIIGKARDIIQNKPFNFANHIAYATLIGVAMRRILDIQYQPLIKGLKPRGLVSVPQLGKEEILLPNGNQIILN